MMERQERLEGILGELAKEPGVVGAALVSRDGLAVRATGKLAVGRETFSAMTATFVGAAEIALAELDGGPTLHVIVATERAKLIALGATRDLLLVACMTADTPAEKILPRLEAAAQSVASVVAGG